MTILKYDLLNLTRGYLAHGVNCQGVMGAGIAKALATKYPELAIFWSNRCKGPDKASPGQCYPYPVTENLLVYNLTTQEFYGKKGRASLEWVAAAVKDLESYHSTEDPIFMPPIGTGYGGLNWQDVKTIFETSRLNFIVCDL